MKRLLSSIILFLITVTVAYGDWFPITAWAIKYDDISCTTWVAEIDTGWHGNSIMTYQAADSGSDTIAEAFLKAGADHNVDFIMAGLNTGTGNLSLTIIARSQFSLYESEEHSSSSITSWPPAAGYFDSTSFSHFGYEVTDPEASDSTAWKMSIDSSGTAGYMQGGLVQHKGHRQEFVRYPYNDTLEYEARFFIRCDTLDSVGTPNYPVCRIEVWRDTSEECTGKYELLDYELLERDTFSYTSAYDSFSVWFKKDKSMATYLGYPLRDNQPMDYRIYWYRNCDLYADRVELRDEHYYNLEKQIYYDEIGNIVTKWNSKSALKYYYLWDEPELDQFPTFPLVKQAMGVSKPPITSISHKYGKTDIYGEFIKNCLGNEDTPLLTHKYFLTPLDTSTSAIQNKFTALCAWMDTVREIADTAGPGTPHRDVWYVCQAHSWIQPNGVMKWRNPLPHEVWALGGLGLAHGAKGLLYYCYKSKYDSNGELYIRGLKDWNGEEWQTNEKWESTCSLNVVLQQIEPFLLDFEFQNAFRGDGLDDYIKYSSLSSLSEFGLFEDSI